MPRGRCRRERRLRTTGSGLACLGEIIRNQPLRLSPLSPSTRRLFHNGSVGNSVALSASFLRLSTCDQQAFRASLWVEVLSATETESDHLQTEDFAVSSGASSDPLAMVRRSPRATPGAETLELVKVDLGDRDPVGRSLPEAHLATVTNWPLSSSWAPSLAVPRSPCATDMWRAPRTRRRARGLFRT